MIVQKKITTKTIMVPKEVDVTETEGVFLTRDEALALAAYLANSSDSEVRKNLKISLASSYVGYALRYSRLTGEGEQAIMRTKLALMSNVSGILDEAERDEANADQD